MSIESNINLELYWKGSYDYKKNWNILTVNIEMGNFTHEIFANINTCSPSTNEQRLNFTVRKSGGLYFSRDTESETIRCPMDFVKSMKISARILKTYENRSMMVQQGGDAQEYKIHVKKDDLLVCIGPLPKFQPAETYQIKIVNEGDQLRATIEKKVSEVAAQQMPAGGDFWRTGSVG